jgi:hypothetical protein
MKTRTLIDIIEREMSTDDDDRDTQSNYLRLEYREASEEAKNAINMCFVALCGWSLETLIEYQQGKRQLL